MPINVLPPYCSSIVTIAHHNCEHTYLSYFSTHLLTLLCRYFSAQLPCCALIFLRAYPAVLLFFFALTSYPARLPCCALIFLRTADVHEKKNCAQQGKQKAG